MLDSLYDLDLAFLSPIVFLLIAGPAVMGSWLGARVPRNDSDATNINTLTGASLGLLALLLAFSFSIALSRFDVRRTMVLEEANAIGSTANFALMLEEPARAAILPLLRDYTRVRASFGHPYSPEKLDQDVARSVALQEALWRRATEVAAAAPGSLSVHRFVNSLNEMNNIHERRLTALRYHVPVQVLAVLIGVTMVAMGFTGYNAGLAGSRRPMANLIMATTVAMLIMLVIDLDRPYRGLIQVPDTPLLDTLKTLPP